MTHPTEPTRRDLLATSARLAGAAALMPSALARAAQDGAQQPKPWFRISLAEWSLHRALGRGGEKTMDNLDFPRVARETYGIEAVEYVNAFFKDEGSDFGYLRELEARAKEAGVENVLIMIDGEGNLAEEGDAHRREAVENHFRWISAAAFLGCHSIRVNAHGGGEGEARAARAADSLRRIARVGDQFGINVIVENHGGLSSDGSWLSKVMRIADHPRVGTLPDFGNFNLDGGKTYDRYKGVTELMPYAKAVSAKSHDFDEDGNERHTDYRRMMSIVKDAGYRGWVGIEYEGGELSEHDGILATKRLLERVRSELA